MVAGGCQLVLGSISALFVGTWEVYVVSIVSNIHKMPAFGNEIYNRPQCQKHRAVFLKLF